jgi:NAD(P)-dependent dehydrogenase (short-subunit alcohol dehydrogenase family)
LDAIDVSSLFSLQGKTALVTGGSRGIGEMIARGFLEAGAKVYISARKAQACEETAQELGKIGPCIAIPADVSTADGARQLAARVAAQESKLDILVNNAGASWGAPMTEYPESGWDKVMDTNVKGIFYLTVEMLKLLENAASAASPARVINIGSINGLRVPSMPNYAYSASKAAVHQLTAHLAKELGRKHITVNAIAPGPFESKMTEWMLSNMREEIEKGCPLGRIGSPSDMAGLAIFLASRAGAYVNGAVIPLDGGIIL